LVESLLRKNRSGANLKKSIVAALIRDACENVVRRFFNSEIGDCSFNAKFVRRDKRIRHGVEWRKHFSLKTFDR
jgi:hypothetical protein